MKHTPFSDTEKDPNRKPDATLLPVPSQDKGLTWLVEVRRQLPGHSSRDVALLAGSQRSLVRGVSFRSGVRGPAGRTKGPSAGRHLVN